MTNGGSDDKIRVEKIDPEDLQELLDRYEMLPQEKLYRCSSKDIDGEDIKKYSIMITQITIGFSKKRINQGGVIEHFKQKGFGDTIEEICEYFSNHLSECSGCSAKYEQNSIKVPTEGLQ